MQDQSDRIQPTAEVIAFPRPAPPAGPAPEEPAVRLRRALAMLDAAEAEQREAVARWQIAIAALNHGLRGLGATLAITQQRLENLSATMTHR